MVLSMPLLRAALLWQGPRPAVWGLLVPGAVLQAVGMIKCLMVMVLAAGEPRGGPAFPADAVVVSVARFPSNGEWPLQIPEPLAAGEWEGRAGAGLNNSLLGRLLALCGPSCSEFQTFCSLVGFPAPSVCPAACLGCDGARSAHPASS